MTANYTKQSLDGVWVGDCIGNLGQLYFCHDILKALEEGLAKFGGQLDKFQNQFQYSDDTEEAIVLYNHLINNQGIINQDALAMEFATRYMDRDPDGEIYGYGLNTRKVLSDIYNGVPWTEANKIIKKVDGMPSHVDNLVSILSSGKGIGEAMSDINETLRKQSVERIQSDRVKEGSCGNGSAMRIAPLGAYMASTDASIETLINAARLSAEPTHCHSEGIAGAIATALASYILASHPIYKQTIEYWDDEYMQNYTKDDMGKLFLKTIIKYMPESEIKNKLTEACNIAYSTPLGKVIEILGNGKHVTCQDTVPFCCYMASKAISKFTLDSMYENAIIETSMAFGDVDTNCAIVGGIVAVISPPPQKWIKFCQPMEGLII